jgi:glucokinase
LAEKLAEVVTIPVAIEGDVRALALAEGTFGAAKGIRNYASLVVSTGVGGALVLDGSLLDGDSGNAGHLGHVNVVPNGRPCSCGARGCLEAYASGWAITQAHATAPVDATPEVRAETATYVGRAIGTLASVLDFNHCFVAGSVALGYGDDFFATATGAAREMATMHYSTELTIAPSGLGDTGPLLGAALVGWRGVA